jgi:hypothetical protein
MSRAEAMKKLSRKEQEIEARKAADPIAQALGRTDIDYSSDELPTAPRFADGQKPIAVLNFIDTPFETQHEAKAMKFSKVELTIHPAGIQVEFWNGDRQVYATVVHSVDWESAIALAMLEMSEAAK